MVPATEVDIPFTVTEAADLLRVTKQSVYTKIAKGELPSVRFGRMIRLPRRAFSLLLAGERDEPV